MIGRGSDSTVFGVKFLRPQLKALYDLVDRELKADPTNETLRESLADLHNASLLGWTKR